MRFPKIQFLSAKGTLTIAKILVAHMKKYHLRLELEKALILQSQICRYLLIFVNKLKKCSYTTGEKEPGFFLQKNLSSLFHWRRLFKLFIIPLSTSGVIALFKPWRFLGLVTNGRLMTFLMSLNWYCFCLYQGLLSTQYYTHSHQSPHHSTVHVISLVFLPRLQKTDFIEYLSISLLLTLDKSFLETT